MFELRQLRQFIATAEELNFRRAAERLHMSQPPLTVAIRSLEREIGEPLFERSRHHVRLTSVGRLFLEEARQILLRVERSIERVKNPTRKSLHLAHLGSTTLSILPSLLRCFRETCPDVDLRLTMAGTFQQLEMLRRGDVDMALLRVPVEDARGLRVTVLCEERMALAVPKSHPLAKRVALRIDSLKDEDFIGYPPPEGQILEAPFRAACQRAGFFPRIVQHAPQMFSKLSFVASGLGVTMVPRSMKSIRMPGIVFIDLDEKGNVLGYALALVSLQKPENEVASAFVAAARDAAALMSDNC